MIVKRKHTAHYAIVPNSTADDENLAADALGVLVFLIAKPDNWVVSVANLRQRFGLGKHRVYGILKELAEAGYVQRSQSRNPESRFVDVEYIVFDTPQTPGAGKPEAGNGVETPLPENREAVECLPAPARPARPSASEASLPLSTASRFSASRKSGSVQSNKYNNPPSEGLTPPKGALEEKGLVKIDPPPSSKPPSINKQVWDTAKAILAPGEWGCVTKWLQRVHDRPQGRETLLRILESAQHAGTLEPVPYITAAINREFPPPQDPRTFTRDKWELAALAATNTRDWPAAWGPRPGERGCLMPRDLISPELTRVLSVRVAA